MSTNFFNLMKYLFIHTLLRGFVFGMVAVLLSFDTTQSFADFSPQVSIHYRGYKRTTYTKAEGWLLAPRDANVQVVFDMARVEEKFEVGQDQPSEKKFQFKFTAHSERFLLSSTAYSLDTPFGFSLQTVYEKACLTREEFQQVFPLFFYKFEFHPDTKVHTVDLQKRLRKTDRFLPLALQKSFEELNLMDRAEIKTESSQPSAFHYFKFKQSPLGSTPIALSSDNDQFYDSILSENGHYITYVEIDPKLPLFPKAVVLFRIQSGHPEDQWNPTLDRVNAFMAAQTSLVSPAPVTVNGETVRIQDIANLFILRSDLENSARMQ